MRLARALMMGGGELVGWSLANASYDGVSFSVATEETTSRSLYFKPDGTKMYVTGSNTNAIYQYSLSTAWDLSTASYDTVSFSVGTEVNYSTGLRFKADGTKFYVIGFSGRTIYQYSLATAWDLSTASYDTVSFSVATEDTSTFGMDFKPDGTKMYVTGSDAETIFQYSLSIAWDLSTASYDTVSFSVGAENTTPMDLDFKDDGTKMFVLGNTAPGTIFQYSLSTAWDLSTASYDTVSFDVTSQAGNPQGFQFNDVGIKMYMIGTGDTIFQYSTTE